MARRYSSFRRSRTARRFRPASSDRGSGSWSPGMAGYRRRAKRSADDMRHWQP